MFSKEQIKNIKTQLIQQIESTFPEDKKLAAKEQINAMNEKQLEEFLKQNNLLKKSSNSEEPQGIFRGIVNGQIPSFKIEENKDALAVLEINPISKGHILIIPKKPITSLEKIPQSIFSLAKKISKRLKIRLKAKEVNISSANMFGEFIINVFPVHNGESINSERKKAEEKELLELQKTLSKKSKTKIIKKKPEQVQEENLRLPKRIP